MHFCQYCDFLSKSAHDLNNHLLTHNLLKTAIYDCRLCEQKFFTPHMFKKHLSSHEVSQVSQADKCFEPWVCKLCKQVVELHKRRIHLMHHLDANESIDCLHCDKTFNSKQNFASHLRRHHGKISENSNSNDTSHNSSPVLIPEQMDCEEIADNNCNNITESDLPILIESFASVQDPAESFEGHFGKLLLKLKSEFGIPEKSIDFVVNEFATLTNIIFKNFEKIVQEYSCKNLTEQTRELKSKITNFEKFNTSFKRKKYYKIKFKFIEPHRIVLPGTLETGEENVIYYIPVKETLLNLLEDKKVFDLISRKKNHNPNIMHDYNDGSSYKEKTFFVEGDQKIELLFFEDGLNLNNPLGSAKTKDKMIFVYYALGNLPPELRCKKENIQLAFSFNENMLKDGESFQSIFRHLTEELVYLEKFGLTPFGLRNFKVGMVFMTGDNLGQHQIGGFNANFSKSHFLCRFCDWSNSDKVKGDVSIKTLRTDENFEISDGKYSFVKSKSILHDIPYFKISSDLPPCVAHNLFSTGSFSRDIVLILNNILVNGHFTINDLNNDCKNLSKVLRKVTFPYITKTGISGKMHEIFMLIVYLPIILMHHNVDRSTDEFSLLKIMIDITRVVTAQSICLNQIDSLRILISDYFEKRIIVLKGERLFPKHHYLMHLPDNILQYGPPNKFWTMFFEHKHQTFKYIANHIHNTINLAKSMSEMHQFQQALLHEDRIKPAIVCNHATSINQVNVLTDVPSKYVFATKRLIYKEILFGEDDFVLIKFTHEVVHLLKIKFLFLTNNYDDFVFCGERIQFTYNSSMLYYDSIPSDNGTEICHVSKMLFHKPINVFYITGSDKCICILQSTVPPN